MHLIVGTIAGSALGAMLGVAIGTLVRNQLGAIVVVAAYANAMDAGVFAAGVFVAWTLAFIATATVRNARSGV